MEAQPTATADALGRERRPAAAAREDFLADLLRGLSRRPRRIPSKWFYDERGSALFEAICELPEYTLTRTELGIMEAHAAEMARLLGARCRLVEYGIGSGVKTRLLLAHLAEPAAYVPVDLAREALLEAAAALAARFPRLTVRPLRADFSRPFDLPPAPGARRTAVYFPGSTVGNFTPREAVRLLRQMAAQCGAGGGLVVGLDLRKGREVLERAYDDAQGVTAEFNRNVLARANRELGADFAPEAFRHRAFFDERHGRIEMHLESLADQVVHLAGRSFRFRRGEAILTEYSYKWRVGEFAALARRAGWRLERTFADRGEAFAVLYLSLPPAPSR